MTTAERIREYVLEHPQAKTSEIAEAVGAGENTVKATISKDVKAGRCVRLEDNSLNYSPHFTKKEEIANLLEWKNDTRKGWVDMLTRAAERATDDTTMRLLIKEANKIMNEVMK